MRRSSPQINASALAEHSVSLVARNTFLNIGGRALPFIAVITTVPFVLHRLGTERFGLLSLLWSMGTQASALDFGIGMAVTKFAAEAIGKHESASLGNLAWSAFFMESVTGLLGVTGITVAVPLIVVHVLQVRGPFTREAEVSLYLLAATVPFTILTTSFRGLVEAAQRFDLINIISVPINTSNAVAPAAAIALGWGLTGIFGCWLSISVFALVCYIIVCVRLHPDIRRPVRPSLPVIKSVATYSGFIAAPNLFRPVTAMLDRILLTRMVGLQAVAYYSAGYDTLRRLAFITSSWASAALPAFSALSGAGEKEKLKVLYERSFKFMAIVIGLLMGAIIVFSHDILGIWLGAAFALHAAFPLEVLAAAMFLAWVGYVPFVYLRATGAVDVPLKVEVFLVPIEVTVLYVLTRIDGLRGGSLGAAFGLAADPIVMFVYCLRRFDIPRRRELFNGAVILGLMVGGTAAGYLLYNCTGLAFPIRCSAALAIFACVVAFIWRFNIEHAERLYLVSLFRSFRTLAGGLRAFAPNP